MPHIEEFRKLVQEIQDQIDKLDALVPLPEPREKTVEIIVVGERESSC